MAGVGQPLQVVHAVVELVSDVVTLGTDATAGGVVFSGLAFVAGSLSNGRPDF
jgi:hypothetical protein